MYFKNTSFRSKSKIFCSLAFNYHDSSVSFAFNNKVVLVLEAERIFREKKKCCNESEMEYLVKYGLNILGKNMEDIDFWSMTTFNNPFLNAEDIVDDLKIKEPFLKEISFFGLTKKVFITNHHISHAGLYFSTKFKNSLIISCDGGGDIDPKTKTNECLAIFVGKNNSLSKIELDSRDFITGKTYGICSTFLYGNELHSKNTVDGKFMALAGFGIPLDEYINYLENVYKEIESTDYPYVLDILKNGKFKDLFASAKLESVDSKNFASSVQSFFIKKRLEDIDNIINKNKIKFKSIVLVGGVGLNLELNTEILNKYNKKIFIPPCCDDTGQSLGSLCLLILEVLNKRPEVDFPYLGEGEEKVLYTKADLKKITEALIKDAIVIVHNGRSEIGPRALGNRSFLIKPDNLFLRDKLSQRIKQRESYRPVAPIVLDNKISDYFIGPKESRFMLYKYIVKDSKKEEIKGCVHIDGSARVQSITRKQNKFLFDLIKSYGKISGKYLLLNTSLNLKGIPLSNKIEDSLEIYEKISGEKCLVYNGKVIKSNI